jgi:hypothetical protein
MIAGNCQTGFGIVGLKGAPLSTLGELPINNGFLGGFPGGLLDDPSGRAFLFSNNAFGSSGGIFGANGGFGSRPGSPTFGSFPGSTVQSEVLFPGSLGPASGFGSQPFGRLGTPNGSPGYFRGPLGSGLTGYQPYTAGINPGAFGSSGRPASPNGPFGAWPGLDPYRFRTGPVNGGATFIQNQNRGYHHYDLALPGGSYQTFTYANYPWS